MLFRSVFTGVRRKDLEEVITSKGGKVGSGVSKNTSYLVVKTVGSGSSKEKKALDLKNKGQDINIIDVEKLEELLNDN